MLTEKGGCGIILGVALLLVMVLGFLLNGPGRGLGIMKQKGNQLEAQVMAMVGSTAVSPLLVDRNESRDFLNKQQALQVGTRLYIVELSSYSSAIQNAIRAGKVAEFAKSKGINLSDKDLDQAAISQVEGEVQNRKQALTQFVKPGSPDSEIEKVYAQGYGESSDDTRVKLLQDARESLDSPDLKLQMIANASIPLLLRQYEQRVTVSDADVQDHFKTFDVKRVVLGSGADSQKKADLALKAIQSGTTFEEVMKAYTTEKPLPGKSVTENTAPIPGDSILRFPKRAPLLKLKQGEVSGILEGPDGLEIDKVTAVRTVKPSADSEVAAFRQQMLESKAAELLQKDLDPQSDKGVVWKIQGYKLVLDLEAAKAKNSLPDIKKTYEAAKTAVTDPQASVVASLVMLGAAEEVYNRSSDAEKNSFRKELIAANEQYLQTHENVSQRLEVAELLIDDKNIKEAGVQLYQAARENLDLEALGPVTHAQVANLLTRMKSAGGLDTEVEKQIVSEQTRWEKDLADKKAAADKLKRDMEADKKRSEDEKKKQAEDAKKAAGGTTPGSTTPAPKKP